MSNKTFDIQKALKKKRIESKLNVICVVSNPCNFKRRIFLAKLFIKEMMTNQDINLYLVECIYPRLGESQKYHITEENNPNHLRVEADTILWTKENMINLAVEKLLPKDYKAFAFIDADLYFTNKNWADETLRVLNDVDIIQPYTIGYKLDKNNKINTNGIFFSKCYAHFKSETEILLYLYNNKIPQKNSHFVEGWAWVFTRKAYEQIGGLFDLGIVGSGDTILHNSLISDDYMFKSVMFNRCSKDFIQKLFEYRHKCKGLKIGYINNVIYHFYHGDIKNRKYLNRWDILVNNNYSPSIHLKKNKYGMYEGTELFSDKFKTDIETYFKERNEDE
jgi:hypothetical protein